MRRLDHVMLGTIALLAVLLLLACTGWLYAREQAAEAKAQLAQLKAKTVSVAARSVEKARDKEHDANANQMETVNELRSQLADRDARVADLSRRLRLAARSGAGRAGHPPSAAASEGGDGERHPGLRGVDAEDLLVDEAGQLELARFAVSAKDTGETLKGCRRLLRQAWQMTN